VVLRRLLVVTVVATIGLTSCGGRESRNVQVGGSVRPTSGGVHPTARACAELNALSNEQSSTTPSAAASSHLTAQLNDLIATAPAEMPGPLRVVVAVNRQVEADPRLQQDPFKLGTSELVKVLRAGFTLRAWWQRACGPQTATSRWCQSFGTAWLDYSVAEITAFGDMANNSTTMTSTYSGPGLANEWNLTLYRSILSAAPANVRPSIQLLIHQYMANKGRAPQDNASVAAAQAAQDVIVRSVKQQCGLVITADEF
jgi:hypothetical protein